MAIMFFRLAGISAALAGIFVVALEVPSARGGTPEERPAAVSRPAPVRVAASEPAAPAARPAVAGEGAAAPRPTCGKQAWPYVDPACMPAERRAVRTISIDARHARNSILAEPVSFK